MMSVLWAIILIIVSDIIAFVVGATVKVDALADRATRSKAEEALAWRCLEKCQQERALALQQIRQATRERNRYRDLYCEATGATNVGDADVEEELRRC
jgi:hypothetical protein